MPAVTSAEILSTAPAALRDVFLSHHARMLRAAYRVTGNAQDAEDVLQSVFVKLLRRDDTVALSVDAASYLQRAAVNAALDLVRSRRRASEMQWGESAPQPSGHPQGRAEERLSDSELRQWLRGRLAEMSPLAANIFALRYFEGFSNMEVADILGTTQGTVAVILHRTRRRLRDDMRAFIGGRYERNSG